MICRKCNNEIDDNVNVCPVCGEQYGEGDYFQQILEHAMGENTQSSEEIEKLKENLDIKKSRRLKKPLLWAVFSLVGILAIGAGIWYLASHVFVDRGDAVYTASFNGDEFVLIDENGNEIRRLSSHGTYSEASYDTEGNCTLVTDYFGPVSFKKTEYNKDGLPSVTYSFDGTASYTYSDIAYEYKDGNISKLFKAGTDSAGSVMELYYYDDKLNTRKELYSMEGSKKHEFVYDSVGRTTGEKDYDAAGNLVFDKEYSYLPDGTLYLSSENRVEKTDSTGAPLSYRLTKYNENGSLMETLINDASGNLVNKIEYTYEGGKITGEKIYNAAGVEIGAKIFQYNEDGSLSREVRGGSAGSGSVWYSYDYHENGVRSVMATAMEKDSTDYITYSQYDSLGREIKNITKTSHVEYEYGSGNKPVKKSVFKNGELSKYTVFEYDENQLCISEAEYDGKGASVDSKTYEYDSFGNVSKMISAQKAPYIYVNQYDEAGGLSRIDTYQMLSAEEFEYDKENVVKETYFDANGNVERITGSEWREDGKISASFTSSQDGKTLSRVEYIYKSDGIQTGLKRFDSDGKEISRGEIEYDDKFKIITVTCTDSDGEVYYRLEYNYSKNKPGIIVNGVSKIKDARDEYSYTYAFNDDGRLTMTEYSNENGTSSMQSYSYDELGNPVGGIESRRVDDKSYDREYIYTYENGCLHTSTIKQNGEETSVTYELDENKRPYLKGGLK